ncbi:MAG: hypothetical protein FWC59_00645, partial [Actinomycetia bacterium]|nr:hypothetical protein [Actinomycetes bacterium]
MKSSLTSASPAALRQGLAAEFRLAVRRPGRLAGNRAWRWMRRGLVVLTLALLWLLLNPSSAWALSTDRVTARFNDSSLSMVIGGQPTRLTWVGTVAADEQVAGIILNFPDGTELASDAYAQVQEMVMDDPAHPVHSTPTYTEELTNLGLTL